MTNLDMQNLNRATIKRLKKYRNRNAFVKDKKYL